MDPKKAPHSDSEAITSSDGNIHGAITRREFLDATGKYTVGGLAAAGIVQSLHPTSILAGPEPQNDPRANSPSGQTVSLTARISRFVAGTRFDAIPPKAVEMAKTAILDCLGVAVAGGMEESAQIGGRLVREEGAKEETTVYGQRFKSSALQAAFVGSPPRMSVPMPISSTMRFLVIVLQSGGDADARYQDGAEGAPPFAEQQGPCREIPGAQGLASSAGVRIRCQKTGRNET